MDKSLLHYVIFFVNNRFSVKIITCLCSQFPDVKLKSWMVLEHIRKSVYNHRIKLLTHVIPGHSVNKYIAISFVFTA